MQPCIHKREKGWLIDDSNGAAFLLQGQSLALLAAWPAGGAQNEIVRIARDAILHHPAAPDDGLDRLCAGHLQPSGKHEAFLIKLPAEGFAVFPSFQQRAGQRIRRLQAAGAVIAGSRAIAWKHAVASFYLRERLQAILPHEMAENLRTGDGVGFRLVVRQRNSQRIRDDI